MVVINAVVETKKIVKKPAVTEMVTVASLEACRVALDDGIVDVTEVEMIALLEACKQVVDESNPIVDISDNALVIVLKFVAVVTAVLNKEENG